ncbi:MAG: DUF72 domain-containing protein [Betaproteobacteria bacterium]|nr:DUF72 domain-containing protein [Betaproteobacteria bacterium]
MTPGICIGTSGWSYRDWKEGFYAGVKQKDWLAFCAGKFTGIEVNATFYHQLRPATFEQWRNATPEGFAFAVKGHRYLTHVLRLEAPRESLERQRESVAPLGERLAAMLWQTPQGLGKDLERLKHFLGLLDDWPQVRHVLEFRNPSWFESEVAALLAHHRVGACQSDAADWPMWDAVTTDLVYVRLHGHTRTYVSSYGNKELKIWAKRIERWCAEGRGVHVYFDNTDGGAAPRNASDLLRLLK